MALLLFFRLLSIGALINFESVENADIKSLWIGDIVFVRSRGQNGTFEGETSPGICKVQIEGKVKLYDSGDIFKADPTREEIAARISEDPVEENLDLLANANFPRALDLHIEKLHADHRKLARNEILRYQVNAALGHIRKAHRLQIDCIFFIHGKGQGILRDTLIDALGQEEMVKSCRSNRSPLYGDDTLEVLLDY